MGFYSFAFCVLLPDEELSGYTPFQGFPSGLIEREWVFQAILRCFPPTVLELYRPSPAAFQQRMSGKAPYLASPLNQSALTRIEVSPEQPFWVLVCDATTSARAEEWHERCTIPPMLLYSERDFQGADVRNILRERLYQHCEKIFELLQVRYPEYVPRQVNALRSGPLGDATMDTALTVRCHTTTIPNELALLSAGVHDAPLTQRLEGPDDDYVRAIITSADELYRLREAIPPTNLYRAGRPPCSLVLAVPGFYRHVLQWRKPKGAQSSEQWDMLRILQKQKTYAMQADDKDWKRLLASAKGLAVIKIRTGESHTFSSALSLRAASQLCPVIRLPPAINHVSPQVTQLADTLRRVRPHVRKIAKTAENLFGTLNDLIDRRFIERIDREHTHIKIVSNAPLEWLPIRRLPLMLRHCTSRIPATPGALTFGQLIPRLEINLKMEDFNEVLVLRSFNPNDPLRDHLAKAIECYRLSGGSPMPVRFVDVRTRDEFVSALNDFNGALAIFDGHGVHEPHEDMAKIVLSDESINVWELRENVQMPPIFFACACDTHAVNRSHVTVANGLLHCGARAVIASVMPIRSTTAALLAGWMLFQIFELLPDIVDGSSPRNIRWDEAFGYIQRMMFVSEFLRAIVPSDLFRDDAWRDVQTESNYLILTEGSEWYEAVVRVVARQLGLSDEAVQERQATELPFPEILKYLHVGNPETIVVSTTNADFEWYVDSFNGEKENEAPPAADHLIDDQRGQSQL